MALEWTDIKKWFDFKQMKADKTEWNKQQARIKAMPANCHRRSAKLFLAFCWR